jgi:hypothetical protein
MSLSTTVHELRVTVEGLRQALTELVMTVYDDRPPFDEACATEQLAELVLELQASVERAAALLGTVEVPHQLPAVLPDVHEAIALCSGRYWREVRSHEALAELRRSARGRGPAWVGWQQGVELSVLRCEQPLAEAARSVGDSWRELAELLALYLPRSPLGGKAPLPSTQSATS